MDNKSKLLGFYNYTVVLTYIGMLCGFSGIIYSFENKTLAGIICLIAAGFCDMFDGAVASTRKRTDNEKCFGIQIDSLSDLICFGVLPGVLTYSISSNNTITFGIACLYVLCALIRLAYFNVDEQERQQSSTGAREVYLGLPVTLSAMFVPFTYGICRFFVLNTSAALSAVLFVMAAMFLIPFRLKKPKIIGKICFLVCGIFEIGFVAAACMEV